MLIIKIFSASSFNVKSKKMKRKRENEEENEDSPPTTIDKLPDEMLSEIFKRFEYGQLKSACLVCSKWNGIISSSLNFLQATKLKIDCNFISNCEKDTEFTRCYKNLHITSQFGSNKLSHQPGLCDCPLEKILMSLTPFCVQLTHIYFCFQYCDESIKLHHHSMLNIIKICSNNLEGLTIMGRLRNFATSERIKLQKLRYLKIIKCDWILDCIEAGELETFSAGNLIESSDYVVKFLNRLKSKRVSIQFVNVTLDSNVKLNPQFQWSGLKLFGYRRDMMDNDQPNIKENWSILCKCPVANATLTFHSRVPCSLMVHILNNIDGVLTLRLSEPSLLMNLYNERHNRNCFDELKVLQNIEKIEFIKTHQNESIITSEFEYQLNQPAVQRLLEKFSEKLVNVRQVRFLTGGIDWYTAPWFPKQDKTDIVAMPMTPRTSTLKFPNVQKLTLAYLYKINKFKMLYELCEFLKQANLNRIKQLRLDFFHRNIDEPDPKLMLLFIFNLVFKNLPSCELVLIRTSNRKISKTRNDMQEIERSIQ